MAVNTTLAWDDLRTILHLVRHGTLAAAAGSLGVNYTTVARRISRAEAACGQPLFERLADGYRPTEAAFLIADHAAVMEETEHGMMRQLLGRDGTLSGPLTITAPQLLIAHFLAPMLEAFNTAFPEVDLRIRATNELMDLTRREADLAVRISRNPGDTLKGLRLLRQETASFASADWAARLRDDPTSMVDWIVYDAYDTLPKGTDPAFVNQRVRFRFDDMVAMAGAAEAGLGVVRMPMFLGRALDGLEQVPVLPPQSYSDVWAVAHPDVWHSARVRAFVQLLVKHCKTREARFVA